MAKPAIGFYWTLPVPWAGFTTLSKDPDEAARQSRTVRYQREVIRRCAKEHGYALIAEHVFLEIEPDRVSDQMQATLFNLRGQIRKTGAKLLIVDFADGHGQRRNIHLAELGEGSGLDVCVLKADPIMLDGRVFHPSRHFEAWQRERRAWSDGKAARILAATSRARELMAQNKGLAEIATQLDAEGLRSATGKPWTADGLRKTLKASP